MEPTTDSLASLFGIRRWYGYEDETLTTETGHPADGEPLRRIVVAACVRNPYANGRFTQDLGDVIGRSPALGLELGRRVLKALDGAPLQSYGKACVVGTAGEYEHGNAFLTSTMMDPLRELLGGGLAWVPSTGKRGGPGTCIDIPLAHKDALYVRSHYDTVSVTFPDAPNPDEILVIFAVATRGRLHARLGGIRADAIEGKDGLR
jgi:hypothetical protein